MQLSWPHGKIIACDVAEASDYERTCEPSQNVAESFEDEYSVAGGLEYHASGSMLMMLYTAIG